MREALLLMIFSFSALTMVASECPDESKVAIVYLNGVQNTEKDAEESTLHLKRLTEESLKRDFFNGQSRKTCYKYAYNQSNELRDFIEVFAQKMREEKEDFTYEDLSRWIFDRADFIEKYIKSAGFNLDKLKTIVNQKIPVLSKEWLEGQIKQAEKEENKTLTEEVVEKIKKDLLKRSVLVVSHSQGNLFANRGFDALKNSSEIGEELHSYANLQVATPANILSANAIGLTRSIYMTAYQDIVINGLRLVFPALSGNMFLDLSSVIAAAPVIVSDAVARLEQNKPMTDGEKLQAYLSLTGDFLLGHSFKDVYTSELVTSSFDTTASIFKEKFFFLADKVIQKELKLTGGVKSNTSGVLEQQFFITSDTDSLFMEKITSMQVDNGTGVFEDVDVWETDTFELVVPGTGLFRVKVVSGSTEQILEYEYLEDMPFISDVKVVSNDNLKTTIGITYNPIGVGYKFYYLDKTTGSKVDYVFEGTGYMEIIVDRSFDAIISQDVDSAEEFDASLPIYDPIKEIRYVASTPNSITVEVLHDDFVADFPVTYSEGGEFILEEGESTTITFPVEKYGNIKVSENGRVWDISYPKGDEHTFQSQYVGTLKTLVIDTNSDLFVTSSFEGGWTFSYVTKQGVAKNLTIDPSTRNIIGYLVAGCSHQTRVINGEEKLVYHAQDEYNGVQLEEISSCDSLNLTGTVDVVYRVKGVEIGRRPVPIYKLNYSKDL